jgi:hypothetical protein
MQALCCCVCLLHCKVMSRKFHELVGISVITPTYAICAGHILVSVCHTSANKNISSHTLCLSSTEPVIKKFSTAWYTVCLHGTVDCVLFYSTVNNFYIMRTLQKCSNWTGSVQLNKFHICTKTIWTQLAKNKCLKTGHSSCSVISRKHSHSINEEEMHIDSSHFPVLKDMT